MKRPQLWQLRLTPRHEVLQQARFVFIGVHRRYRRLLWLLLLWSLLLAFAWHWLFFVELCGLAYLRESLFCFGCEFSVPTWRGARPSDFAKASSFAKASEDTSSDMSLAGLPTRSPL
jgi:hypothetical protein